MVHGSLVKRIPKGYLYKYTIVFIVQQYFFKFEIFGLDLYLLPILLLKLYKLVCLQSLDFKNLLDTAIKSNHFFCSYNIKKKSMGLLENF